MLPERAGDHRSPVHFRTMVQRSSILALAMAASIGGCRGPAPVPAAEPVRSAITAPADIFERMAEAHAMAPAAAVFTQVSTVTLTSTSVTQRQRVLVQAPVRMRVDNIPLTGRTGAIYVGRRAITFANGRRVAATSERNPLLLLGFGVYRQTAAETQAALAGLGIAESVMREATYDGAPVWIIGAAPGDTTSNQVWIDASNWVPVRLIQSERRGARTVTSDTRYAGHAPPYPTIPRVIEVYRGARRVLRAEMSDLRTGIAIPASAFDTTALRPVEL